MTFPRKISVIIAKLIALFFMVVIFGMDMVITHGVSEILWWGYFGVGFACLTVFIGTFFKKISDISWGVWGVCLLIYLGLSFNPSIKEQRDIDACIDRSQVWDYDEHRCRADCWRWTKEKWCEKE